MEMTVRETQLFNHMCKCSRGSRGYHPILAITQYNLGGHRYSVFNDIPEGRVRDIRSHFWKVMRKITYRRCFRLPAKDCRSMLESCRRIDDIEEK